MKRTWKQIGSLLISVCMVFTMLPTAASAKEGDSGAIPGISKITAFADLAEDVALQKVETGTTVDELKLPNILTVTVATGSAIAATVSGDEVANTLMLRGTGIQASGTGNDITADFSDPNFLAAVRTALGKNAGDSIYDTDDFASVKLFDVPNKEIASLAGIEYFTELTYINCKNNQLMALDVSHNTKLVTLTCQNNILTKLDVSHNTMLNQIDCSHNQLTELDVSCNRSLSMGLDVSYNYMADESAVKGLDKSLTTNFTFEPQNSGTPNYYAVIVNNGTASLSSAKPGETVTITASTPSDGKQFKGWTVVNGGVTLFNKQAESTTFIMPAEAVEVTANYEDVAAGNNITNKFTDANFLAVVRTALGKSADDSIYDTDDFASVTALMVINKGIANLAGIEYFTELTSLPCSSNNLTSLDVSNNTKLTILDCSGNKLTSLDVSNNTKLATLICYNNNLTELDVSNNTKLTILSCGNNKLTGLDVSNNTLLTRLSVKYNYMTDESAVTGLDKSLTTNFTFDPQNTKPSTYSIKVNNGTASPLSAKSGETVTITAETAADGKKFKEWKVVSGGVTLFNAKSAATTFIMPANAVEVTATYEDILAGVSVSTAAELKTALEATTSQTINVTADITFTEKILQGADHTLVIPSGKTVTGADSVGYIGIGSHTLTINGGGTFVCNRNGNALYSNQGILNLKNITVNVTGNNGIQVKTTNVDSGAMVILNSSIGDNLIQLNTGYVLNINTGGSINIINFANTAIMISGGMLHINGGTLAIGKGQSNEQFGIYMTNYGFLKYSAGTLSASDGAVIALTSLTSVEGVSGRFIDGGYTLTADSKIAIDKAYDAPSADGLTAGYYNWNNSKNAFEKQMITIVKQPQDVTVTEGSITGSLSVTASASNAGALSYQWEDEDYNMCDSVDTTFTLPTDLTAGTHKYRCRISAPGCMGTQTRTVTVTVNPAGGTSTYAVTINNGTASPTTAAKDTTVTITANTPDSGKQFKEWTVVSGGAILGNAQSASTTFTMPANAVEVTATYEDIPAGATPVTGVTLNQTAISFYSNTSTKTANLTATIAPSGAADKAVSWQSSNASVATVDASGLVTAVGNGTATITVTTNDGGYTASCTVTVSTYSSGGWVGGGSFSGGKSAITTPEQKPDRPVTASAPVTAAVGTNGTASASIPDKAITDAITQAQTDAKEQGKIKNGVSVALDVTMPKGATSLTAALTRNALNNLVSARVNSLEIKGSLLTVTFDKRALTQIQKKSSGSINITIAPKTKLSKTAKKMIGTRPVYNIAVNDSKNSTVSSFGGGVVTVAIPYTPANDEAVGGIYAVYVDENGNATRIAGSAYDANSGSIIFTTPHFSIYGAGYTAPTTKFSDINKHWAKESIDYVVGRGLLLGTTKTTFAPDADMTRGGLVTALGKLAGIDTKAYTASSFTDVKADSAYFPYVEWAYKKGVIQGIGNSQFAPNQAVTREQIAVILKNYAKATGYTLPITREAATYADAVNIGSTYKDAVKAIQQAGIMMGGSDNKFNPKENATRAEVSSMLWRYIKLTIDPDTAQGWAQNDDGQYLYYKDGKSLTGTQTIDGVKYFFNADGTLKSTRIDDYEVDENGVGTTNET